MRVALVHDDLVQWGGAERVLLGISEIYPDATIFTSLYNSDNKALQVFKSKKIVTSFLQQIPGWESLYKLLLPLYGLAFEQFDFSNFDLVISQSTRFAKSIITKPETRHICYCHTPPRFLWHFSGKKSYGLGEILLTNLRIYDQISARRVDGFIAGSKNAQKRISRVYKTTSKVVLPFVDLSRFSGIESFDGDYFVVIGRSAEYKRFDLAKEVCEEMEISLKVISGGLEDTMVQQILAGCKALILPGIEDFGLTSLEAQALGKPVIAYKAGGALETIIEGKTGIFFSEQTRESLKEAILEFDTLKLLPEDCKKNAQNFSKEKFTKDFKRAVTSLM